MWNACEKTFGLHPLVAGITTCSHINLCTPRLLSFSADLLLPSLYFLENQKQFPDQVSLSLEPGFTGICPSVSTGKSPSSKGRFPKAYCPLSPIVSSPLCSFSSTGQHSPVSQLEGRHLLHPFQKPTFPLSFISKRVTIVQNYLLFFLTVYFMCLNVLSACMCVHHMCTWCPGRSEEGVRSSETGDTDVCGSCVGSGNPDPL